MKTTTTTTNTSKHDKHDKQGNPGKEIDRGNRNDTGLHLLGRVTPEHARHGMVSSVVVPVRRDKAGGSCNIPESATPATLFSIAAEIPLIRQSLPSFVNSAHRHDRYRRSNPHVRKTGSCSPGH